MAKNMMGVLPRFTANQIEQIRYVLYSNRTDPDELMPDVSQLQCMDRKKVMAVLIKAGELKLARRIDPWLPIRELGWCFLVLMTITLGSLVVLALIVSGGLTIAYLGAEHHYLWWGLGVPYAVFLISAALIYKDFK